MKKRRFNHGSEKSIDALKLDHEISEDFRETSREFGNSNLNTNFNWSQSQDRGEDLINETDPFIQQPERDTQVPPELIQQRAYHLYEQRRGNSQDNLADWFEAERQLRQEIKNNQK